MRWFRFSNNVTRGSPIINSETRKRGRSDAVRMGLFSPTRRPSAELTDAKKSFREGGTAEGRTRSHRQSDLGRKPSRIAILPNSAPALEYQSYYFSDFVSCRSKLIQFFILFGESTLFFELWKNFGSWESCKIFFAKIKNRSNVESRTNPPFGSYCFLTLSVCVWLSGKLSRRGGHAQDCSPLF